MRVHESFRPTESNESESFDRLSYDKLSMLRNTIFKTESTNYNILKYYKIYNYDHVRLVCFLSPSSHIERTCKLEYNLIHDIQSC